MKNYNLKWATLILTLIIPFFGCSEDALEQRNLNSFSEEDFWKTGDDAFKGIIGAYSVFQQITYYRRFEIFLSDYRDDVINPFNTSDRTAAANFNAISTGNPSFWLWSAMFQGVARANNVLFNVPEILMDEATKNTIIGEAHFLRAYNYFQLVSNFKNVPLYLKPSDALIPSDIVQEDPRVVMAKVIEDFEMASKLLPDTWDVNNKGRATKASAFGYLGKALLYEAGKGFGNDSSKYALAAAALQKVIDDPNYGLVDNYADNFSSLTENNKESIFEIQLHLSSVTGWGADNSNSGTQNAFTADIAAPGYTGQDSMNVNQWVLDLYMDETTINGEVDPRAFVTLMFNSNETTMYEGEELKSTYFEGKTYAEAFPADPTGTAIYGKKYIEVDLFKNSNSFAESSNNLRVMRYADVLLMFAEAELMKNGGTATPAAVDAINLVRRRVDMPDFNTSLTMQDIEDERVKELTFERTRYFDLLRWDRVKDRIVDNPQFKSNSAGTSAYKAGREYIDIPQREININFRLKPNPGY